MNDWIKFGDKLPEIENNIEIKLDDGKFLNYGKKRQ